MSQRPLLSISGKLNLKRNDKYVALLKQRGMKSLNYQMDHILHQIFKIILTIS